MLETGQLYFPGHSAVPVPEPVPGRRRPDTGGCELSGWQSLGAAGLGAGREFGINGESSGKDGVITMGGHRWYSLSYAGLPVE